MKKLLVAVTGASGQLYAGRLIEIVKREHPQVELYTLFTNTAKEVWKEELCTPASPHFTKEFLIETPKESIDNSSYFHPFASGSNPPHAAIVIPCTLSTVGRVASGSGGDLLARIGDVMLKERLPLIMAIRETPLNLIHLKNLTKLAEAGAIIAPASPSFYHKPKELIEIVDNFARRVLSLAGIDTIRHRYTP
ncbi:MAG: UbiX family flavin prenyltransferase [Bacteroidales bacterium]